MDKNEMNESLNELSGQVIAIGQRIGRLRDIDDLETLSESLHFSKMQLDIRIWMLKNQKR